jgi:hypothetical protein
MIPFGVTRGQAYALVQDGELHVRFGPMFDERIPIDSIETAEDATWPRWAAVGPRANFRGAVGLIGALDNVVKLTFKEPIDVRLFVFPISCRRLYLSLVHPDHFLEALGKAPTERTEAKQAA